MAKDIEEFLRRAAERRRQQKSGQSAPAQPPRQQPKPAPAESSPRPIQREPLQSQPQTPIIIDDVEIVKPSKLRRQSVQEHVQEHMDTSNISRQSERLGKRISRVASDTDARVHQHLDHDLSKIDDLPTITDDPSPAIFGADQGDFAKQLRAQLANPKSVGQAILIAEILKRPEFD